MKNRFFVGVKILILIAAISITCFACKKSENNGESIESSDTDISVTDKDLSDIKNTNEKEDDLEDNDDNIDSTNENQTSEEENQDDGSDKIEEDENKPFESKLLTSSTSLDGYTSLVNGIPKRLATELSGGTIYDYFDPNEILTLKCGRFLFMKDGSVIDLQREAYKNNLTKYYPYDDPDELMEEFLSKEYTETFLTELNRTVGIKDIRDEEELGISSHIVYACDGSVYKIEDGHSISIYYYERLEDSLLEADGTLNCPEFPEAEEWTDIIDYRICEDFILGLTSDGKLLSAGIDFEYDNIKIFEIWSDVYYYEDDDTYFKQNIPIALHSDGYLIIGEFDENVDYERLSEKNLNYIDTMKDAMETARSMTDIVDFNFHDYKNSFLIRKSDDSLWCYYTGTRGSEYYKQITKDGEVIEYQPYRPDPHGIIYNPVFSDEPFESKLLPSSPSLGNIVKIGDKIINITRSEQTPYTEIDAEQVITIKCDRFVFFKDGSIIDLQKERAANEIIGGLKSSFEPEEWDIRIKNHPKEITEIFLNNLNKSVGIKDIREDIYNDEYIVFAADGNVYYLQYRYSISYGKENNPILNTDGTLNCPQFPETEEWTDIVDYRMCDNFILALTSDGKLLSLGTDFDHENIKMFDIFNFVDLGKRNGDFPVAVTKDGKMIFGNLLEGIVTDENIDKVEAAIEIAKTFTDVEDFVFQWGSKGPVIIVRKTDGTLLATENEGLFNSEYINLP